MITCTVCNETLRKDVKDPETVETGVCSNCRKTIGVVAMGEPVRPPVPCSRCTGMKFLRVMPRSYGNGPPRPMPLAHKPVVDGNTVTAMVASYFGDLEVYICEGCGFIEWYCRDRTYWPTGPEFMTERIDYTPRSEYR